VRFGTSVRDRGFAAEAGIAAATADDFAGTDRLLVAQTLQRVCGVYTVCAAAL
jgi:hypothetical protein